MEKTHHNHNSCPFLQFLLKSTVDGFCCYGIAVSLTGLRFSRCVLPSRDLVELLWNDIARHIIPDCSLITFYAVCWSCCSFFLAAFSLFTYQGTEVFLMANSLFQTTDLFNGKKQISYPPLKTKNGVFHSTRHLNTTEKLLRTPVISVDSTACHVIKDVVNDFRMRGEQFNS